MDPEGDQNPPGASTNGSSASGSSSRPSAINSMSLYERQAVQALQALQRQPNAAQYFQQLMLQQQINNAQLHSLAAAQQASLAASRQSSPPGGGSSYSSSQTSSSTSVSVTPASVAMTSSRPVGGASAASVLLSGTAAAQGQMYLRVNRSLRATPISSQLIFMPTSTATAAVATVTQQQHEDPPTSSSSSQSDMDQVQNLALRGVSGPKGGAVKTEAPERRDSGTDAGSFSVAPPPHQLNTQSPPKPTQLPPLPHIKIPTYPQPTNLKAHPPTSSSSSIPLSQLLLHGTRTLSTGAGAATAAAAGHTLVLASNATASSQTHGFPVATATIKPAVNAQTLVVQPLQKTTLSTDKSGNGPIPIQPKTLQGLRLPLQLPSRNPPPILPAPPPNSGSSHPPNPPHIPVQIVGARQSTLGNSQAVALPRGGNCSQDGSTTATVLSTSSSLLTMVASIASREGGVTVGRGVGLKEAVPVAQVSHVLPQTNQSSGNSQSSPASAQPTTVSSLCRSSLALPLTNEEQRGASATVTTNGDSRKSPATQVKPVGGSLKRKSDSNSTNDEEGPAPSRIQPVRDHAPVLPTNPVKADSAPPPAALPLTTSCSSSSSPVIGQVVDRAPPPQAVVKPHVLTHLIEGFVIQEGAQPFPVCGSVKDFTSDSPDTNQSETVTTATVLKCEYCKNFAPVAQFRGTKRFCSMSCAKRYQVRLRQNLRTRHGHGPGPGQDGGQNEDQDEGQMSNSDEEAGIGRRRVPRRTSSEIASAKIAGRPLPVKCGSESSRSEEEESSGQEDEDDALSLSPASSASCHQQPAPPPAPPTVTTETLLPAAPAHWSVEEVSQFISSLQGCEEVASQFLSQEIDGQALLLLKEEHLMSTMNLKLGPALKICAHINSLRD